MDAKNSKIYEPLLEIEQITQILNKIAIFAGLNQEELYLLFKNLQKVNYKKDEIICRQGAPAQYIYIVKKGKVKLYLKEENILLELVEMGIGKCFGETSLIGIQPHSANVVAEVDTELIVLSNHALHEFYKKNLKLFSKIIMNIAREACRRLAKTDDTLLHYVMDEKK